MTKLRAVFFSISISLFPFCAFGMVTEITDIRVDASVDLAGNSGKANPDSRLRGAIVAIDPISELATLGQSLTFERRGGTTGGAGSGYDNAYDTAFEAVVTVDIPTLDEIALLPNKSFFSTPTYKIPANGFLAMTETVFAASGEPTEEFVTSQPLAADGSATLVNIGGEYRVTGFSLSAFSTPGVTTSPTSNPTTPTQPVAPPVIVSGGVSASPIIPPFPQGSTATTASIPEPSSIAVWLALLSSLGIQSRSRSIFRASKIRSCSAISRESAVS